MLQIFNVQGVFKGLHDLLVLLLVGPDLRHLDFKFDAGIGSFKNIFEGIDLLGLGNYHVVDLVDGFFDTYFLGVFGLGELPL